MDQVVPEGLQVAPPAVSSSVSVPTGVLQGPVMGLPLIRLVRLVEALGVSAMENKVREQQGKPEGFYLYLQAIPKSTK